MSGYTISETHNPELVGRIMATRRNQRRFFTEETIQARALVGFRPNPIPQTLWRQTKEFFLHLTRERA